MYYCYLSKYEQTNKLLNTTLLRLYVSIELLGVIEFIIVLIQCQQHK